MRVHLNRHVAVWYILSFISIWWWMLQLKINYPEWIFSLLQAIIIYFSIHFVFGRRLLFALFSSIVIGWFASFFADIFLEWAYLESFTRAILEHYQSGQLFWFLGNWLLLSIIYMGPLQSIALLFVLRKTTPKQKASLGADLYAREN